MQLLLVHFHDESMIQIVPRWVELAIVDEGHHHLQIAGITSSFNLFKCFLIPGMEDWLLLFPWI